MQIFAKVANAQAQVATLIEVTDSSPVDNTNSFEGSSAELAELREIASNQVEELRAKLSDDISKGRVNVEQIDNQVKITLADQGSFTSGSADLRAEFYGVLNRVGEALGQTTGEMVVAGHTCLLYTSPSPRDRTRSRMPSSA